MKKQFKNIFSSFSTAELKPGLYHGFSALIDRVAFFILFVFVGRVFGDSELGKISTALNFANILHTITDFGLPVIIQRTASRGEDSAGLIRESFIIKLTFSGILYFALLIYAWNLTDISVAYLSAVYLGIVVFALSNYILVYFIGINRNKDYLVYQFLSRAVLLGLFLAVVLYADADLVPFSILCAALFQLTLVLLNSNITGTSNRPKTSAIFTTLRKSYPIWLGLVFVFAYDKIDILIITGMRGTAEAGSYFSAYSIMRSLVIFTSFYLTLYFTKLSGAFKSDRGLFRRNVKQSIFLSISLSLALFAIIFFFAEIIVTIIYGEKFSGSGSILNILAFAIPFIVLNYNLGSIFNSMDLVNIPMIGRGIALAVNISLNLILIPKYGITAAAYVTVITEGSMLIYLSAQFFSNRILGRS